MVKFLIEKNADVEQRDRLKGATPLSYACAAGQLEIVKFLVAKGAEINEAANDYDDGGTPLWIAAQVRTQDLIFVFGNNLISLFFLATIGRSF